MVFIASVALAAPATADVARGIDHAQHGEKVAAAGHEAECVRCHKQSPSGLLSDAPNHTWCFGACHEDPAPPTGRKPYNVAATARPLCEVCHDGDRLAEAATAGSRVLRGPAAASSREDFATTMSHATHQTSKCNSCHRFATPPRPHSRCIACHKDGASAFAMTECAQCHALGRAVAPESPFSTGPLFSHAKHSPRVGPGCVRCHVDAETAPTVSLAEPAKSTCTDCHDGTRAFSTIAPSCRRCHPNPEVLTSGVRAPPTALSHATHGAIECQRCHDETGAFRAEAGHTLCSSFECHPSAFAERKPTLCSSCHVGSEPWLKQHLDAPRRPASDFGVVYAHGRHPATPGAATESCVRCHAGEPESKSAGVDGAHAACAGSACHDLGASAPPLSACDACHVIGSRAARRVASRNRDWSVAARFVHKSHRLDASGADVGCASCHAAATEPGPRRDFAPPAKPRCVPCHNGETAFKVTGHGCKKCHAPR